MKKRLLSGLLTLCMVIGLLPMSAFATTSTGNSSDFDALISTSSNTNITLDKDYVLTKTVKNPGMYDVDINMNGHTITWDSVSTDYMFEITNYGSGLTFTDTSGSNSKITGINIVKACVGVTFENVDVEATGCVLYGTTDNTNYKGRLIAKGDSVLTSSGEKTVYAPYPPYGTNKYVTVKDTAQVLNSNANGYAVYIASSSVTGSTVMDYINVTSTATDPLGKVYPEPTVPEAGAEAVDLFNGTAFIKGYDTLQDAIDDVTADNNKVVINETINLGTTTVNVDKGLTLDLNGNTITSSAYSRAIYVKSNASLTVMDSKSGGEIKNTGYGNVLENSGSGKITINGGTLTATGSYSAIDNVGTGEILITAGTLTASVYHTIYNYGAATVNVEGGTVEYTGGSYSAIYNNTGAVNISSGTVKATNEYGYGIYNKGTGKITISGDASVTAVGNNYYTAVYLVAVPADPAIILEIKDTAEVTNSNASGYAIYFSNSLALSYDNSIQYYSIGENANVGETYPEAPAAYIYGSDGSLKSSETSLANAVYDAVSGDKIVLNADITVSTSIDKSGTYTLDLAGHTISTSSSNYAIYFFSSSGNWIIMDSVGGGDIISTASGSGKCAIENRGTLTINLPTGTVRGEKYAIENSGTLYIQDGTIETTNSDCWTIYNDNSGKINISGGTVQASGTNGKAIQINSYVANAITMSGGTVQATDDATYAIYMNAGGGITITGGTVKTENPSYAAILGAAGTTSINISQDAGKTTLIQSCGEAAIKVYVPSVPENPTIQITGGKVENTKEPANEEDKVYAVYLVGTVATSTNVKKIISIGANANVGKIYPGLPTPTASITNTPTYDGTSQAATIQVKVDGAEVEATVSDIEYAKVTIVEEKEQIGEYSTTAPTNAGTYKVRVDIAGSDTWKAASDLVVGNLVIAQRTLRIKAEAQTIDYGKTISTGSDYYTIAEGSLAEGHKIDSLTLTASRTDAGTGAITPSNMVIKDTNKTDVSSNYYRSYTQGTLKINAIAYPNAGDLLFPTASALTYGKTLADSNLSFISNSDGKFAWKDDSTVPDVENEGYTVVFTPDDTNYKTVEKDDVDISVSKATPTLTAPTASGIAFGETLADSTFTGGSAKNPQDSTMTVAGTFAWTTSTTKPAVSDSNTTEYSVTFTPNDNYDDNYNTNTINVKVTVSAKVGTDFTVTGIDECYDYTGSAIEPTVTVKDGTTELTLTTDYTVTYGTNKDVGDAAGTVTIDFTGNYSGKIEKTFKIDYAGLPEDKVSDDYFTMPTANTNGWYKANDSLAAKPDITIGTTNTATGGVTLPDGDGEKTMNVYVKDGTNIYKTTITYKLDETKPVITYTDGTSGNPQSWTKDSATISFTASDGTSGVDTVVVKRTAISPETDDVAYAVTDKASFTADQNGIYTITVTDNAGNVQTQVVTVTKIDKTAPVVALTTFDETKWYGNSEVTATVTEDNKDTLTVSGGNLTDNTDIKTASKFTTTEDAAGTYTYTVTATDKAGNDTDKSVTIHIDPIIDIAKTKMADISDSTKLAAANQWYESLTGVQQNRIENSDASTLVTALKDALEAQSQNLANDISGKIEAATTLEQILEAKTAYDALPDGAKVLVTNADILTTKSANASYASAVKTLIQAAQMTDPAASYETKLAAVSAYDSYIALYEGNNLIVDQATNASNIKSEIAPITALITRIQTAKNPYVQSEIQAIIDAYTALSNKALFDSTSYKTTYDDMAKWLENTIALAEATAEAQRFFELVDATMADPSVENIDKLIAAKDALTEGVFASLPQAVQDDYDDLVAAKPVIESLNEVTAENVKSDDVNDYNGLTDTQKAIVDKATGNKAGQITAALEAINKIQAIPVHGDGSDVGDCDPNDHAIDAHKTAIEEAKIAYEKLTQVGRDLVSETAKNTLNGEYTALMSYLEYISQVTTATTTVEVAGLAEKVDVGDTTGISKTTVSVVAEDSKPVAEVTPTQETKQELLSVDVKLVAQKFIDEVKVSTEEVQPTGGASVVVKLELPTGYELDTLEIWHVKDDGARSLIKNFNIVTENQNNYAIFEVESFSHFVLFADATPSTSSGGSTSYTSSVASAENGTVRISGSRNKLNTTITITATPDDGYEVASVTVTYGNSREVSVTDNGDGTYSYKQPGASVTVAVIFVEIGSESEDDGFFTDVDEDDWFYDAVKWAVENDVTSGKSATSFAPYDINTRAEAVTFLYRGMGEPEYANTCDFTDIEHDNFYYDAVLWAVENGITKGTSDTTFSPYVDCTRAQIITMLWRMAGEPIVDSINPFTDVDVDSYYYNAVLWAVGAGITDGTSDTTFSPDRDCTRGEIVTFLYRNFVQ